MFRAGSAAALKQRRCADKIAWKMLLRKRSDKRDFDEPTIIEVRYCIKKAWKTIYEAMSDERYGDILLSRRECIGFVEVNLMFVEYGVCMRVRVFDT